jgi:hypothetical protein
MNLLFILVTLFTFNINAQDILSSFEMDIYKVAVSESEDCGKMTIIIDHENNPKRVDLFNNPSFGKANVEPGTYHCVAIEVSPMIHITPVNPPAGIGTCIHGQKTSSWFGYDGTTSQWIPMTTAMKNSYLYFESVPINYVIIPNAAASFIPASDFASWSDDYSSSEEPYVQRLTMYFTTRTDPNGNRPFLPPTKVDGYSYRESYANQTNNKTGISISNPLVITDEIVTQFILRITNPAYAINNLNAGKCTIEKTNIEFDFQI